MIDKKRNTILGELTNYRLQSRTNFQTLTFNIFSWIKFELQLYNK